MTRAVTIAGFDPSGGAGVTADLRTFCAWGCRGAAVIAALTAQDAGGVRGVRAVEADFVAAQLAAVLADGVPAAVKTGMLLTRGAVLETAAFLESRPGVPVVVDPVLASSGGVALLEADAFRVLVERLVPRATLVTPNALEAAALTGIEVRDAADARAAGEALLERGARAVLVKGGHVPGDEVIDTLVLRRGLPRTFSRPRISGPRRRGTGCALSAAIAAGLARGLALEAAIESAGRYVHEAMRQASGTGASWMLEHAVRVEGMP
jgi:hydroxymethylpyrimidine/phosphomethylpyrimidine kinase